jgi:hypothetical protein
VGVFGGFFACLGPSGFTYGPKFRRVWGGVLFTPLGLLFFGPSFKREGTFLAIYRHTTRTTRPVRAWISRKALSARTQ